MGSVVESEGHTGNAQENSRKRSICTSMSVGFSLYIYIHIYTGTYLHRDSERDHFALPVLILPFTITQSWPLILSAKMQKSSKTFGRTLSEDASEDTSGHLQVVKLQKLKFLSPRSSSLAGFQPLLQQLLHLLPNRNPDDQTVDLGFWSQLVRSQVSTCLVSS